MENNKESNEQKQTKPELIINPNTFENNSGKGIDYEKVINMFGCKRIDKALLERFEKVTGTKPHHFLTREIFFSHRYFKTHLGK